MVGLGSEASGMAGAPVIPVAPEDTVEPKAWIWTLACAAAAEQGQPELPMSVRLGRGDAARVLTDLADDLDAFCLVVGSRGDGAWAVLSRILRPSVSRALLRERRVPVLVAPDSDSSHDAG